jgi:hypothetical protein
MISSQATLYTCICLVLELSIKEGKKLLIVNQRPRAPIELGFRESLGLVKPSKSAAISVLDSRWTGASRVTACRDQSL